MKLFFLSISLLSCFFTLQAQTIWSGPNVTFTKAPFADPGQAANQDRITPTTWITRGNTQGIFNAFSEPGYSHNSSPSNTEWATGSLANYASLTYQPWENWAQNSPPSTVGVQAVMHIISDNIYLSITFLSWDSRAGGGGGFSYQRSTSSAIPAPVKLASFTASKKNKALQLNWKTVSEENTSTFDVERSSDGKNFNSIGTMAAAGNSSSERFYSFTDNNPLASNFYRLRTNDANGAVSYSNILSFKFNKTTSLEVFPVPASNVLHVQLNVVDKPLLQIMDVTGRILRTMNFSSGDNAFTLEIGDLKKGVYFLRSGNESKMFIKE